MSKKKSPKLAEAKQRDLNLGEIAQLVESRIDSQTISQGTFSLSELAKITDESPEALLYLEKKGILKPVPYQKTKRTVKRFTSTDLENALFAKELRKHDYTPQEIALLISAWRKSSALHDDIDVFSNSQAGGIEKLDQTTRAQTLLLSRLLAIEAALICGFYDAPKNSIIGVRRLEKNEFETNDVEQLRITTTSKEKALSLLMQDNSEKLVRGISTQSGEALVSFRVNRGLPNSLEGHKFVEIYLFDNKNEQCYQVILGLPKGIALDLEWTKNNLFSGNEKIDFLIKLLRFTFSTALRLHEIVYSKSAHTGSERQLDILHVMAEAITHIAPDKWDYCGILVPKNSTTLKVSACSREFPSSLRDDVFGIDPAITGASILPVWVYANREAAAINRIIEVDQRIPNYETEHVEAVAAVPAMVGEKIFGVIYVASRKLRNFDTKCFDQLDLKFLRLFGQIIGEAIQREDCAGDCVRESLEVISEQSIIQREQDDLKKDVRRIVEDIANLDRNLISNDSLVVLTIQVDGILEIAARRQEIATWISDKVQEKMHRFLESNLKHDTTDPNIFNIYKFDDEQYVAILNRTRANHRHIRTELEKELSILKGFGLKSDQIVIYAWSLEFTYRDLSQRLKLYKNDRFVLATELMGRIQGGLTVLPNIRRGNDFMNAGKYDLACVEFEMAHLNDPSNPYVLRHLAECKIELKQYKDAIDYGKEAVKQDENYPKSYIVLGNAFTGYGDYESAAGYYKKAIELNPKDPSPHLHYGQALVLEGSPKRFDEALEQFTLAMNCDGDNNATRTKYLNLKAEACLRINDYERAIKFLNQALAYSPEDQHLRWSLNLAERLANKNNNGGNKNAQRI